MGRSPALSLYLLTARSEISGDRADRQARSFPARPEGCLIWFHTGRAALPTALGELMARLAVARDDLGFLVTSDAEDPGAAPDLRRWCTVLPVPQERLGQIRHFLRHWAPDVAVWTEADLRPALIAETDRAGIPLYMIDANTAAPSAGAWRWRRGMTRELLACFKRILAGSEAGLAELRKMGAPRDQVEVAGYLEEGTAALPCSETECDALAQALSARQVWLAAGAVPDEVAAAVSAHRSLLQQSHRLLLILVPLDPAVGPSLAHSLRADGWVVGLRTEGAEPEAATQIYIADTDDEFGLWYRLAPISFMGNSLFQGGGRNPYEAAALGSAILHGPNVKDFCGSYDRFAEAEAARLVRNAEELADAVEALLHPEVAARMAQAAWTVSSAGAEVTDRAMEMILTALDRDAKQ